MEPWIWAAIAAFLVLDGVVTFLVLSGRRRRRETPSDEERHDDLARQIGLQ